MTAPCTHPDTIVCAQCSPQLGRGALIKAAEERIEAFWRARGGVFATKPREELVPSDMAAIAFDLYSAALCVEEEPDCERAELLDHLATLWLLKRGR